MRLCEDVQSDGRNFSFSRVQKAKKSNFLPEKQQRQTERRKDLVVIFYQKHAKKSGRIVSRVFRLTHIHTHTTYLLFLNGFFCQRDDDERGEHFEWSRGEQQEENSVLARGDDVVFFPIFFFHSEKKTKNGVVTIHSARRHDDEDWRRKRKRKEQKKKRDGCCRDGDE